MILLAAGIIVIKDENMELKQVLVITSSSFKDIFNSPWTIFAGLVWAASGMLGWSPARNSCQALTHSLSSSGSVPE